MSTLTAPRLCRVLSLMAVTLLAGCSSVSYYGQLAQGLNRPGFLGDPFV
ncbi:hypothetical protein AC519_0953 [Pseudomonas savastanoi]|nr:hypothetical protein AC519_0953 [Pseudomonas savastanoi]